MTELDLSEATERELVDDRDDGAGWCLLCPSFCIQVYVNHPKALFHIAVINVFITTISFEQNN